MTAMSSWPTAMSQVAAWYPDSVQRRPDTMQNTSIRTHSFDKHLAIATLLFLSLTVPTVIAQPLTLDTARIQKALSTMVDDGRAAGTSVLIWKDGREAYFGAAGFADREAGRKMSRDTIAQIYS